MKVLGGLSSCFFLHSDIWKLFCWVEMIEEGTSSFCPSEGFQMFSHVFRVFVLVLEHNQLTEGSKTASYNKEDSGKNFLVFPSLSEIKRQLLFLFLFSFFFF